MASPPKSPTLLPPRKSVELEDSGAHDLDASEAEDEIFSDAREDRQSGSRPASPIPITRVEKVDDRETHGEIPGTAAYRLRAQDAVPDEIEILEKDGENRSRKNSAASSHHVHSDVEIPKTVVEKIDPLSPSHGDIPGTIAHAKRRADAIPDVIKSVSDETTTSDTNAVTPTPSDISIPTTVITKVDSLPSHGEVPGTEAYEKRKGDATPDITEKSSSVHSESSSRLGTPLRKPAKMDHSSPIAADGGFGPMESDEEDEDHDSLQLAHSAHGGDELTRDVADHDDDFDDFEAGNEEEDFGDFDDASVQDSDNGASQEDLPSSDKPLSRALPPVDIPYPLLDFTELESLDDILIATKPYLDQMFPSITGSPPDPQDLPPSTGSVFLTERSLSLWSQLIAPPPLQPPNWVRSRIRRLFLVSLGVPVDLDEILPASKQKKLVLPSIHLRDDSPMAAGQERTPSRSRISESVQSPTTADKGGATIKSKRRKGPAPPPDVDLTTTRALCMTSAASLSVMSDDDLQAHASLLLDMTNKASEVLEYWLKRKDSAMGDKDAFEGVIENLVKHARRVRKK